MLSICVFLIVVFRWWIFEWLVGTKFMYLLDTLLFTVASALFFSNSGKWVYWCYFMGFVTMFIALYSSLRWIRFESQQKEG